MRLALICGFYILYEIIVMRVALILQASKVCVHYTLIYMVSMLFISRCIGIDKFILRLQNVNIMPRLQIRSGGVRRSDVRLLGLSRLVEMLIQLEREHRGIQWLQRRLIHILCLQF